MKAISAKRWLTAVAWIAGFPGKASGGASPRTPGRRLAAAGGSLELVNEGIDVAVRIGALADSSMAALPVGEIRRIVVPSPALLEAAGLPEHPRELPRLPCVRFTALMPRDVWHFVEDGRALQPKVGGPFACNQAAARVDACVAGLGFGLLLSCQAGRALEAKELKEVLNAFERPPPCGGNWLQRAYLHVDDHGGALRRPAAS